MHTGFSFFKTTAIGGAIFLIPIVIIAAIIGKALGFMRNLAMLFSGMFKIDSLDDVLFLNILSFLVLVLLCFLAGLLSRTKMARRFVRSLEDRVLDKIPLYLFIKSMTVGTESELEGRSMIPVWLRLDDFTQLAFEVERQEDGQVVVFLPGAPNPWSGALALSEAERVTPAGMTMMQAISYQTRLGKAAPKATANPVSE